MDEEEAATAKLVPWLNGLGLGEMTVQRSAFSRENRLEDTHVHVKRCVSRNWFR